MKHHNTFSFSAKDVAEITKGTPNEGKSNKQLAKIL